MESAHEKERRFDWTSAADDYAQALPCIDAKDWLEIGKTHEARANALFRFAFQADDRKDFIDRLKSSEAELSNAKKCYDALEERASIPWSLRCSALTAYSSYWMSSEINEKRSLIIESWSRAKESLDAFDCAGEGLEFVRTLNVFSLSAELAYAYSNELMIRERIVKDAVRYSERALALAPSTGIKEEIAKAYSNSAHFTMLFAEVFIETGERGKYYDKAWNWIRKSLDVSRETASIEFSWTWLIGYLPPSFPEGELDSLAKEALEISKRMRDRLATGSSLEWMQFRTAVKTADAEDADARDSMMNEALAYSEQARNEFSVISFIYPFMGPFWSGAPSVGYYAHSARLESDLTKKREYAEKGLEAWPEEFKVATESGLASTVPGSHWDAALLLTNLAMTERDDRKKKEILEQSIGHVKEFLSSQTRLYPHEVWFDGAKGFLAEAEHEISQVAADATVRLQMARQAITHMKENIEALERDPWLESRRWEMAWLGDCLYLLGKWQVRLCDLSGSREDLANAVEPFSKAMAISEKMGWPSRVAEDCWQLARVHDALGDHSSSSEWFGKAAQHYSMAAEKVPKLSSLFQDQSAYMEAWSEIEKARDHHARQELASAKEHYNKSAELHESAGNWSFLSTNYFAWAQVENAEDLSQKERCKESIDAFREAVRLFKDSKRKMQEQLAKIEVNDEKQMAERLIGAADNRQELCRARIALEEARLLDKEGELGAASEKYGLVADKFSKIKKGLSTEQDRKEIELIITLSKAWKAMAKAETESSSELYEEAAHLFDEAKNLSPGDKAKNLAMGHSRFCRALQAGVKFSDSGDLAQHDIATNDLENAAKYYLKAGLESASEYARASKLLFDAYMHMSKASKEEDHERKTKFYALAEKILQASASSYEKADQPGKKEQVLKLLAKVQQDKELAVSLAEVFRAPDIVSTSMAFSSPTPTQETAVGLDRFAHADVQATLVAKPKGLHVGQELGLEIELVNAGRGAAQLMKIEEIIPKGFVIVQEPEKCRVEDSHINLRGRKLDALKTEDLKLVLKPTAKGNFRLRPRIMYLDDSGTHKSCEPAPVEVVVKEMGISGWIKGTLEETPGI